MNAHNALPSLKKNYLFSAFSAGLNLAYPIFTFSYVARILGPETLGKYYFANSFVMYFLFAACLGIPVYGAREIGRVRGDPHRLRLVFSELIFLNGLSSIAAWVIYTIAVFWIPDFHSQLKLFLLFGLMLLNNAFTLDFLYTGLEKQGSLVIRSIVAKLLSLVLILVLIHSPADYLKFTALVLITSVSYNLLGAGGFKYWTGFKAFTEFRLRSRVRPLGLITLSILFVNVYVNLDSVILGFLSSHHEVGLYNAAMRPCRLLVALVVSFTVAALPRLAYYVEQGHAEASQTLMTKSFDLLCLVAIPLTSVVAVNAHVWMPLLLGPAFSDASQTVVWASSLIVLSSVSNFLGGQVLLPRHGEMALVWAAVFGALASLVAAFALIPLWGRGGAVFAVALAEVVSILVQFVHIRRLGIPWKGFSSSSWKYGVAGLAMTLVQWILLRSIPNALGGLSASLVLGGLVYGLLLLAFRESITLRLLGLLPILGKARVN